MELTQNTRRGNCLLQGGTLYDGLYGEAPPKRGIVFRLQVYERVGMRTAVARLLNYLHIVNDPPMKSLMYSCMYYINLRTIPFYDWDSF